MKRIINFEKIDEVVQSLKEKCNLLRDKEKELLTLVNSLNEFNQTENIKKIVLLYQNEIKKLDKTVDILEFYIKIMENNSVMNHQIYSHYKQKLINSLIESDGKLYAKY